MANPHEEGRPIVVKRVKKGGHAAHGGSWKVAFADFAVAMMAFFLILYLIESATPKEKIIIAGYFADPIGFHEGGQPTVIDLGGSSSQVQKQGQEGMDDRTIPTPDQDLKHGKGDKEEAGEQNGGKAGAKDQNAAGDNPAMAQKIYNAKASEKSVAKADDAEKVVEQRKKNEEFKKFVELEHDIKKMIEQNPSLSKYKDQILLEVSSQGLQIQIMDKEKRPMYESGSDTMNTFARDILAELGKVLSEVPNRISITGHTDSVPYSGGLSGYTNWELSADRANGARRALVKGGVKDEQLAQVVGLSSSMLFDTANPLNPINRRISILVLSADSDAELSKRQNYERDLEVDQSTELTSDKLAPPSAKELPGGASSKQLNSEAPTDAAANDSAGEPESAAPSEGELFEEVQEPLVKPYLGADHVPDTKLKKPKGNPDDLPLPSFLPKVGPADLEAAAAGEHAPAAKQTEEEPPLPSFVPKIGGGDSTIVPAVKPGAHDSAPADTHNGSKAAPKAMPFEPEPSVKSAPGTKPATVDKPATNAKPAAQPKNNAFWDE